MFGRLMRQFFRTRASAGQTPAASNPMQVPAIARLHKIRRAHERAPLDAHLHILFDDIVVGDRTLLDITGTAAGETRSGIPPLKVLHRRYSIAALIRYFQYARRLPGRWAECGVFQGYSALSLCLAARAVQPDFDGSGLHLVDSFEGLSPPGDEDRITDGLSEGAASAPPVFEAGFFRNDVEFVRATFAKFPGVEVHKGWIPAVLNELPDSQWSFVHIDVDLYEPTLGALEYFLPRLAPGGVVICDDYGSAVFPGAARAWDEVCEREGLPFVELPTGQSVLLKPAA